MTQQSIVWHSATVTRLTSFISPFRAHRNVKGLYKKARVGEIREFTGISSPYEAPQHPDLVIDTHLLSLDESVEEVLALLGRAGILTGGHSSLHSGEGVVNSGFHPTV